MNSDTIRLLMLAGLAGAAFYAYRKPAKAASTSSTSKPEWFHWAQLGADAYWEAWGQGPDGKNVKLFPVSMTTEIDAQRVGEVMIEQRGGTPVRLDGPPNL